jgi:WD40 repeat protein
VLADANSGEELWKVPRNGDVTQAATLSSDGDALLVSEQDVESDATRAPLRLWRVSTRKSVAVEATRTERLMRMVLSAHGRWLALDDERHTVALVDGATGKIVARFAPPPVAGFPASTHTLVFSPDESLLAQSLSDGRTTVWHVPDGRVAMTLQASALAFSEDGKTLVLGGAEGGAPWLRDFASGAETRLSASTSKVSTIAIANDGSALFAGGADGPVRQWDLTTGEVTHSFSCPPEAPAYSVAASPAAPLLAVGCNDGSVTLWNRITGERVAAVLPAVSGNFPMTGVMFAPGGEAGLVLASVRSEIVVWDIASRSIRRRLQLPPGSAPPTDLSPQLAADMYNNVKTMAVDPSGRLLAVGRQAEVSLWDLESGQFVRRMGVPRPGSLGAQMTQAPPMTEEELKKLLGRSGGGLLGGLKRGSSNSPNVIVADGANPFDATEEMADLIRGAEHLAFSNDGLRLYADSGTWEVATGYPIKPPKAAGAFNPMDPQAMLRAVMDTTRKASTSGPMALSADNQWVARAAGRVIRIIDATNERDVLELKGHRGSVEALAFSADGRRLFSAGDDGAVRIWAMPEGRELVALTALGAQDFVAVTPDQYYRVSKARLSGIAFRQNKAYYPFEQFDIKFNRPDIILERLGRAPPALVQSYRQSYQRRLTKLGLTESSLGTLASASLPQVSLSAAAVPVTTEGTSLELDVNADGSGVALDRLNVFVNDVPVYGTRGLALEGGPVKVDRRVTVPLVKGRNKVQVSVQNARGVESLRQTAYTTSTAERAPAQVWVVAIGVSQYQRSQYSLRYAAKDAADIANVYRSLGERTHVLNVSNSDATRQGIEAARKWLEQAKADDLVIVFAAGHGMTDSHQNYYFGTYDIDPDEPGRAGLPFESFESLLDGIAPLRKLLLVDTCFSGEIDKDEPAPVMASSVPTPSGTVVMRSFKAARGVAVVADDSLSSATASSVRFQQDWFADLRRGTGAVVISSASGSEYALEGEQWNNGVFTYALLDGLKNRAADANGDREVTVGELQTYVSTKVIELTRGGQNPTVRRENLAYDFAVF